MEEKTKSKDVRKNQSKYDKLHSFPDVLEHDQDPEEVHAYHCSLCSKNRSRRPWKLVNSSDELTLTQAQKLSFKWQLYLHV